MFKGKVSQNWLILIAALLGIGTGIKLNQFFISLAEIVSTLTIKTLQLISLPIIFLSIIATLGGMESLKKIQKMGTKVLKYTLITTIAASSIALALYLLVSPVRSVAMGTAEQIVQPSLLTTLLNIYPSNIVQAFVENNVMGIVLIAGALGIAILSLPEEQRKPVHHLFSGLFSAFLKIAGFMIKFLPIGVWAFMALFAREVATNGFEKYTPFLLYLVVVIGANLIQGFVFLPALLKIKGISPIATAKGMSHALTTAFFSKSSNATLPITMSNLEENLKVPRHITSFTIPLCTTINMNGCAAFILTTVLFVSMSSGVVVSLPSMLLWVLIATLAAIGNAGVPMGCYFLSGALLSGMGVPLELLGLILPMYTLIDMIETALNVWSDACVTTVIAKELSHEHAVEQT